MCCHTETEPWRDCSGRPWRLRPSTAGRYQDFHLQAAEHAQHTTKSLPRFETNLPPFLTSLEASESRPLSGPRTFISCPLGGKACRLAVTKMTIFYLNFDRANLLTVSF
jgi:hypothetical protein